MIDFTLEFMNDHFKKCIFGATKRNAHFSLCFN